MVVPSERRRFEGVCFFCSVKLGHLKRKEEKKEEEEMSEKKRVGIVGSGNW